MKLVFRSIIALGLICLVGLLVFLLRYSIFKSEEVNVPNVYNMNLDEAKQSIVDNNLNYEVVYVMDGMDKVIYTLPYANTLVKIESIVYIYYGCEESKDTPNLILMNSDEGISLLNDKNISYETIYVESSMHDPNIIVKQEVLDNNIILLYISKKSNYEKLPSLEGLFELQAIQILNKYQIAYVLIYEESYFPKGMVIYTNIIAGSYVSDYNQSLVILNISK